MKFKQFIKSKWFPVLMFILLEVIIFLYGYIHYPFCSVPLSNLDSGYKPEGSCPNLSLPYLVIFTIPNLIISIIIYYLIKKFYK